LIFDKGSDYERGLLQGKAQALHAVITLPEELKELKSIEELELERQKRAKELEYEEG